MKLCEKLVEACFRVSANRPKLKDAVTKMAETQEIGERLKGELSFAVKFQKSYIVGDPISLEEVMFFSLEVKVYIVVNIVHSYCIWDDNSMNVIITYKSLN